jgi:hypothetical protein
MNMSVRIFAVLVCALLGAHGCKKSSTKGEQDKVSSVKLEAPLPQAALPQETPTVVFDIKPSSPSRDSGGFQVYECTYEAGGKIARFRLELKQSGPLSGEIPMARAEGKFLTAKGSDNSVLLEDLKKALEAQEIPRKPSRMVELSFDAVVLGEHQSRHASGGYSDKPPGDWILLKLFLPKGGDDGEVFLNLNPVLGKAEFSIKDSDYGDYLLAQFAKVL